MSLQGRAPTLAPLRSACALGNAVADVHASARPSAVNRGAAEPLSAHGRQDDPHRRWRRLFGK
eukprot:2787264-Pleurochrysis_carterae.AAC.1